MRILDWIRGEKRARKYENHDWVNTFSTQSGVHVDAESALSFPAVLQAVRILAEGVAQLPMVVYRRDPADLRNREVARDHSLYRVLHFQPNPEQTPFEFKQAQQVDRCVRGTSYAEIVRDGAGAVRQLWHLPFRYVRPVAKDGKRFYAITDPVDQRKSYVLPERNVLRTPGFGEGGLFGLDAIMRCKEAIGYGLSLNQFGGAFFNNAATPSGAIVLPPGKQLSPAARQQLKTELEASYTGLANAHRIMLLQEGAEFKTIGVTPQEAQYLEARKFSVIEIARIFNVKPHLLMDLERATFTNIEAQGEEHVRYTLGPWFQRIVEPMNIQLVTPSEQMQVFVEFLTDALLKPDIKARYEAYNVALQAGFMTRNEVRQRENLPPLDGLDDPLYPSNMLKEGAPPPTPALPAPAREGRSAGTVTTRELQAKVKARQQLEKSFQPAIRDAAHRAVKAEVREIRKLAKKYLGRRDSVQFLDQLRELTKSLPAIYRNQLEAILRTYTEAIAQAASVEAGIELTEELKQGAEGWFRAYMENLSEVLPERHYNQLANLLDGVDGDPEEAIEEKLKDMEENEADQIADRETNTAGEGVSRALWTLAGIALFVWVTSGTACPLCQTLNGKVVGAERTFVSSGDIVDPEDGSTAPLKVKSKVFHPPLHKGCDCAVTVF